MDLRLTNATQSLPSSHTEGPPQTGRVFAPCTTLPEFWAVSFWGLPTPCTALGELPPPTNSSCYTISLLLAAEPGRLRTNNSVVSVETPFRNNLATRCSKEYPLALIESLYAANSRHETLLLWLASSPWYRTAKCQPSSPCGNSKGKRNVSKVGYLYLFRCNPPFRSCKIMSRSAPILSSSKMAATSLHYWAIMG